MIVSAQTITDYGECGDEHPEWSDNAIEDYQQKFDDIQLLIGLLNDGELSPLSGTGSPEGVETANYSLTYFDLAGPNVQYFNPTFGDLTGWVIV